MVSGICSSYASNISGNMFCFLWSFYAWNDVFKYKNSFKNVLKHCWDRYAHKELLVKYLLINLIFWRIILTIIQINLSDLVLHIQGLALRIQILLQTSLFLLKICFLGIFSLKKCIKFQMLKRSPTVTTSSNFDWLTRQSWKYSIT